MIKKLLIVMCLFISSCAVNNYSVLVVDKGMEEGYTRVIPAGYRYDCGITVGGKYECGLKFFLDSREIYVSPKYFVEFSYKDCTFTKYIDKTMWESLEIGDEMVVELSDTAIENCSSIHG